MGNVVILGAGPTGLMVAYYLLKNNYKGKITIIEKNNYVGGLSSTHELMGNKFDVGPHGYHFRNKEIERIWKKFSKFKRVERKTRIYYNGKLFHYPFKIEEVLKKVGIYQSTKIIIYYFIDRLLPRETESFEGWVTKNFGRELYKMFFKSYTEKVVGIKANEMGKEWIENRVNKLSLLDFVLSFFKINKKGDRTIYPYFYYPLYGGCGSTYEKLAKYLEKRGVKIIKNNPIVSIKKKGKRIKKVITKKGVKIEVDHLISTIPITELITMLDNEELKKIGKELKFRNHITVNIVMEGEIFLEDQWIYIHDEDIISVRASFPQNFSLENCKNKNCISLEYFCWNDKIWNMKKDMIKEIVEKDLKKINIAKGKIKAIKIIKSKNAYPIYNKNIEKIKMLKKRLKEEYKNLQLAGRGGSFDYGHMHEVVEKGIDEVKKMMREKSEKG